MVCKNFFQQTYWKTSKNEAYNIRISLLYNFSSKRYSSLTICKLDSFQGLGKSKLLEFGRRYAKVRYTLLEIVMNAQVKTTIYYF